MPRLPRFGASSLDGHMEVGIRIAREPATSDGSVFRSGLGWAVFLSGLGWQVFRSGVEASAPIGRMSNEAMIATRTTAAPRRRMALVGHVPILLVTCASMDMLLSVGGRLA